MSSSNLKKQTKKWVVWSQTLDPPVISPWQLKLPAAPHGSLLVYRRTGTGSSSSGGPRWGWDAAARGRPSEECVAPRSGLLSAAAPHRVPSHPAFRPLSLKVWYELTMCYTFLLLKFRKTRLKKKVLRKNKCCHVLRKNKCSICF